MIPPLIQNYICYKGSQIFTKIIDEIKKKIDDKQK